MKRIGLFVLAVVMISGCSVVNKVGQKLVSASGGSTNSTAAEPTTTSSPVEKSTPTPPEPKSVNDGEPAIIVTSRESTAATAKVKAADSCKPDRTFQDRFTKKPIVIWDQKLSSTGFMKNVMTDEDITFTVAIQRASDKNNIWIVVHKAEASTQRATFESQYHATKGDKITFGFKDGAPVTLVVTEVVNEAKVASGIFAAKLNMTCGWAAQISDKEMGSMREVLTTKQIDAYSISSSSGEISQNVNAKVGQSLLKKFGCFYSTMDTMGVNFTSPSEEVPSSTNSSKQDVAQKTAAVPVTVDQIIQMVTAKLSDDIIITTIRKSGSLYELTPDTLIKLKSAGVSDAVIRAMTQ